MSCVLRPALWRLVAVAFVVIPEAALGAAPQPTPAADRGLAWTRGAVLVLLEDGADVHNARRWVTSQGGRIVVMLPPRALLGWLPEGQENRVVGRAGIRSLHRTPPVATEATDAATQTAVRGFEAILGGHLKPDRAPASKGPVHLPPGSDAFRPEDVAAADVLRNLRQAGIDLPWKSGGRSDLLAANSEYMVGTVTVSLFFVESNGAGSDPDMFDWTAGREQGILDEVVAALAWWSDQASQHGACSVTFLVQAHRATQDARCAQAREPVLHDSATYAAIVADVMQNFGHGVGSHLSRVTAYNTAQRLQHGTDWAYSAFVAANPMGATAFTDGFAAWAFLGGPYTALLERSFSWSFRRVFAHESGHIFGACDEYHVEGYGGCSGCSSCWTHGVDNGNCEQCNAASVSCMMKENSWSLCDWTPGQVGWWRSPCIPGALPPPVVAGVSPDGMWQAQTGTIELHGEDLNLGSSVDLGAGVQVREVTWISSERLLLEVDVDPEAAPGWHDVTVVAPEGASTTLAAAFEVHPTPVHYVSPQGSALFPFASPATAGNDLDAVLAVVSAGDTVHLATGIWDEASLRRSVVIQGGWDQDFTVRQPTTQPTILTSTHGSVLFLSGKDTRPTLDGLVLRHGRGDLLTLPALGPALLGGAALILEAAPHFRDCVFEDNRAGSTSQAGAGGAVFLFRGHATFERCTFRGNEAGAGAALYVLEGEVTLQDNRFEANRVQPAWGSGSGGALHLEASVAHLQGDVFDANVGARRGGAVSAAASSLFAHDVQLRANTAEDKGGALYADSSDLWLQTCTMSGNAAGFRGGGIFAVSGELRVFASAFTHNLSPSLGGAIHADGMAPVLENLSLTGNSGGAASGVYLDNVLPGARLTHSVLAFNGIGGAYVAGGEAPWVDWNVYWQNHDLDLLGVGPGPHDLFVDPLWADVGSGDLHAARHAPILDSGDPQEPDPDGSRRDRGAHGGPLAQSLAPDRVENLTAAPGSAGTLLQWSPVAAHDVAAYLVYRGARDSFPPDAGHFVAEVAAPGTNWEDDTPTAHAWYRVVAVDVHGRAGGGSAAVAVPFPTDTGDVYSAIALHPVTPNPVRPHALVSFSLPYGMHVQVLVVDARGRRVRQLASGSYGPGRHRVGWDGRTQEGAPAASGVYWIQMLTLQDTQARKVILVR